MPGATDDHTREIKKRLSKLESISNNIIQVPLLDFPEMFSIICNVTLDQLRSGCVTLLPDGPKPLSLALAMTGHRYQNRGVSCVLAQKILPSKDNVRICEPVGQSFGLEIEMEPIDMKNNSNH